MEYIREWVNWINDNQYIFLVVFAILFGIKMLTCGIMRLLWYLLGIFIVKFNYEGF